MPDVPDLLQELAEFLDQYPAIEVIDGELEENGTWRIDFTLDGDNPNAWDIVKLLGFGFNRYAREFDVNTFVYPVPDMTGEYAVGNRIVWRLRNMTPKCTPEMTLDFIVAANRGEFREHFAKH